MVEREATLAEVELAFHDQIAVGKWFPRIAELAERVGTIVGERQRNEAVSRAQQEATPIDSDTGEVPDYRDVATRDLPPGYDYAQDDHWLRGVAVLQLLQGSDEPLSEMGRFVARLDAQRGAFQGASKDRDVSCPSCRGVRYVRLGGWDANPGDIGAPGSRYVRCVVCCPDGSYSVDAERAAARRAVLA